MSQNLSTQNIGIGNNIPSFSVKDHEGIEIDSEDLIGSPFILYFYPKDDTSACTQEACEFRDELESFESLDTLVIGVSPDDSASHLRFIKKNRINFTLICDENFDLARKFEVTKEKEVDGKKTLGIIRSTFFIDSSGVIRWMEKPVIVDGHIERTLAAVKKYVR